MLKVLFTAVAAMTSFTSHAATGDGKGPCTSDAMIVLDASGSMLASDFPEGAPRRIDRVRNALAKFLPQISETRNIGLVIYGPGSYRDDCDNVSLRFGPMAHAAAKIQSAAERVIPSGRTPLTASVRVAADALGIDTPGAIVLLTDGEETCGGNPCNLAHELAATRPNTVVHVIGYKLQSLDGRKPVSGAKCLADETGGYNLTAETTDDLVRAFDKALGCNQLSFNDRGARCRTTK